MMRTALLLFLFCGTYGIGQKTLQLEERQDSPKASLEDIRWITGGWRGEALGGIAEEIWSPAQGKSMMFVFRLIDGDEVSFYEIGHIVETEGTLLMQLKHFDKHLKGWEEKEDTINFKLVKLEENAVYFQGLTMEKTSESQMHVHVLIEKDKELFFKYKRVKDKN